jgi:hypothetical protein
MSERTDTPWTPGPWRLGSEKGYNPHHIKTNEPDMDARSICSVYGMFENKHIDNIRDDPRCSEGLANARLISEAPAMAEALEKTIKWLADILYNRMEWPPEQIDEALAPYRQILARVRGEETT